MQLKTLHLTNSWHEKSGGIATFYRALIAAANCRGQHISLVVPGENDGVEQVGEFGRIYHVKAPRAPFNADYRVIYPTQFLPASSKLQQILAAERPDLVEICDKYSLNYLGALLRRRRLPALDFRPVVVGLSCERMDDNVRSYVGRLPLSQKLCAAYVKWVYFPFFDHHIANSQYTAEELRIASRGHLTLRNTWIRPMGVNLEELSPSRRSAEVREGILRQCRGSAGSVLLLYAGRLAPEKNLKLLFELLAHLARTKTRDFRLLVAGDGIERSKWQAFCAKHAPGKASFLGHVADPIRLADLLVNADAFVHPNPREPFGIAPLQAMASGLPLVAPNVGGITTYATAENAWLAPPDVASFAAAVEQMLADDALRIHRRERALQTAERFRWDAVAASFLDLYAQMCRAATTEPQALSGSEFSSEVATGMELAWSRRISRAAEWNVRFLSSLFERPLASRSLRAIFGSGARR